MRLEALAYRFDINRIQASRKTIGDSVSTLATSPHIDRRSHLGDRARLLSYKRIQSHRKELDASIRPDFAAGPKLATMETTSKKSGTPSHVTTSVLRIPNRKVCRARLTGQAAIIPVADPHSASFPACSITIVRISRGRAPSAIRIPNSRNRSPAV